MEGVVPRVSDRILEKTARFFAQVASKIGLTLEETRTPEKWVETLKSTPMVIDHFIDSPKLFIHSEKHIKTLLREAVRKGEEGVVKVTLDHPNQKVRELASAIEKTQEHPFYKKFMRGKKPKVYIVKQDVQLPHIGEVLAPIFFGRKTILVDAETFNKLSIEHLIPLLAHHEMGHVIRADGAARHGWRVYLHNATPLQELRTDELAILTGADPEHLKGGLQAVHDIKPGAQLAQHKLFKAPAQERRAFKAQGRAQGLRVDAYVSDEERFAAIDRFAKSIDTPEKKSHVMAEMERRLEKIHRKLFPRHYDHSSGVTRG